MFIFILIICITLILSSYFVLLGIFPHLSLFSFPTFFHIGQISLIFFFSISLETKICNFGLPVIAFKLKKIYFPINIKDKIICLLETCINCGRLAPSYFLLPSPLLDFHLSLVLPIDSGLSTQINDNNNFLNVMNIKCKELFFLKIEV